MWRTVKLGDVLKTGAGGTPLKAKREYYEGGTIKWLLSGAVCEKDIIDCRTFITQKGLENSSAKLFPQNTVLVAMYGATAGQVGILRTVAATNQAVCGIYPHEDYLPEFLYYYLSNYKDTLLLEVSGVAQPNLSQIKIKNIPLPRISLAEQQRIVAKLDAAFAKIDKLHRTKLTKFSNIQRLSAQRISQLVNALSTTCGKTPLSEVCIKITKGSSPKWQGINYVDEPGILFITSENVGNGELRMEKIKYVENKFNEKDSKSILQMGDVLTNIVGASIGRTAVFDLETSISANINQAVCLLRTDEKRLNPDFLSYLLNSDFFLNALHEGETSTARANISLGFLSNLEIPLPSLSEQILFLEECEALTNACIAVSKKTEKQSDLAEELKFAILSQELQLREAT